MKLSTPPKTKEYDPRVQILRGDKAGLAEFLEKISSEPRIWPWAKEFLRALQSHKEMLHRSGADAICEVPLVEDFLASCRSKDEYPGWLVEAASELSPAYQK